MQPTKISNGQKLALIKLFQHFTDKRNARLWMLSKILGQDIKSTDELLLKDWRKIRNQAYPNWPNDDWTISDDFIVLGNNLYRQYEREVIGQKELFGEL